MNDRGETVGLRRGVTVAAALEVTFDVFVNQQTLWWPRDYGIGAAEIAEVVLEPFAGGRWFERGVDGSESDWGRVSAWEPPHRIVLDWQINAEWAHDAAFVTEIDIRFAAEGPGRTRVELEHRGLEAFAERAQEMLGIFGADSGWSGILHRFAEVCERAS